MNRVGRNRNREDTYDKILQMKCSFKTWKNAYDSGNMRNSMHEWSLSH